MSASNFIQIREGHIFCVLTWYGMTHDIVVLWCYWSGVGQMTSKQKKSKRREKCGEPLTHSLVTPPYGRV
jgi:hypothetical protein